MKKQRTMWYTSIALLVTLAASAASAQTTQPSTDKYVGSWQIKCTPTSTSAQAGADVFSDSLMFKDGAFVTEAFAPYGFADSAYQVSDTGAFSVTVAEDQHGTVTWSGRSNGSSIYGRMVWTKPNGSVYRYYFRGTAYVPDETAGD